MYQTNTAFRIPNTFVLDRNRERKAVFYGRVSTEHEAQLAALENQMQWYDEQAKFHPNWTVLDKYIDEGITGTQAKKRPAFMQMIEDAKQGEFDLIVTREVCRFARNTVDTLVMTRELKNYGVEVYFVEDNIWTMDGDGELRLTIMATLAQEESRKISERVRAGQKISRDNGVLYGSGNIIGYDRVDGTYVINEDQAETVRMIFDLYLEGLGETKICKELCRRQRKDGHGNVSWSVSKISRILRNATYMGYKCYLKSYSNNYLEQKRIKNLDESTYLYVKGDFEPIISEEVFKRCEEIRKSRTTKMVVNKGERTYGKKASQDVWLRKLRCACGSTFRKNKWRTNQRGDTVFGYQCYNQVNNGSKSFREKNGLDTDGYCDIRMIGDWKLDLMAKKIFESIWTDKKDAVMEAYKLLGECYQSDSSNNKATIAAVQGKISRATARLDNLIAMRADGEISKEKFGELRQKAESELATLNEELDKLNAVSDESAEFLDMNAIKAALDEMIDFSGPTIDENIIEKFVSRITPIDNGHYRWDLNFTQNKKQAIIGSVEGRKGKATADIKEYGENDEHSHRTYDKSIQFSSNGTIAYLCLIAACVAVIHGGGNFPRYHDFGGLLAFSIELAVQGLIRVAIEPQVPVEAVLGYHDPGDECFHHTFGHILSFVTMGVLLQRVLEDSQLLGVVYHFLGLSFSGQLFNFLLEVLHLGFQLGALHAEHLPAEVALSSHLDVGIHLLLEPYQLRLLCFQQCLGIFFFLGVTDVGFQNGICKGQHLFLFG